MKWANVTLFIKNIAKLHTYKHTYTLALAAADLKSAMENGSLCQVVLNKDFFQYGCNRVHLSSSLLIYSSTMYIVMVVCSGADCHSKKTRPGANIFFFPSPYSVFLWYKEFHGTIQFGISFLRPPQYIVYHISGWKIYQKATLNLSMQSLSSNEQFLLPGPSVACLQLGRGASKFWSWKIF